MRARSAICPGRRRSSRAGAPPPRPDRRRRSRSARADRPSDRPSPRAAVAAVGTDDQWQGSATAVGGRQQEDERPTTAVPGAVADGQTTRGQRAGAALQAVGTGGAAEAGHPSNQPRQEQQQGNEGHANCQPPTSAPSRLPASGDLRGDLLGRLSRRAGESAPSRPGLVRCPDSARPVGSAYPFGWSEPPDYLALTT